jgi:hypothetical protein
MYTVRFVLASDTQTLIEWPDCGWSQAFRLARLFTKMQGEGSCYIYTDPKE